MESKNAMATVSTGFGRWTARMNVGSVVQQEAASEWLDATVCSSTGMILVRTSRVAAWQWPAVRWQLGGISRFCMGWVPLDCGR